MKSLYFHCTLFSFNLNTISATMDNFSPFTMAIITLVCMILVYTIGRFINKEGKIKLRWKTNGLDAIETTSLGLFGLLLGFTFAAVMSRHDDRRKIIVQEANCIGTATLRADLYDDTNRLAFRKDFQDYVEARIKYYNAGDNDKKLSDAENEANLISSRIWQRTMSLSRDQRNFVPTMQMVPALNEMIDIVTTRDAAEHARLGSSFIIILFVIIQFIALMMGVTSSGESLEYLSFTSFSFVAAFVFMLIVDLDNPNAGLIRLNKAEQKIESLRSMFH